MNYRHRHHESAIMRKDEPVLPHSAQLLAFEGRIWSGEFL